MTNETAEPNQSRKTISEALQRRSRLQHHWQLICDPAITHKFNQANATTKKLLREHSNEEFTNFLLSLNAMKDANFSLYKAAKAARRLPCFKPLLHTLQNRWARKDLEKATTLASYLPTTFQIHDIILPLQPDPQPEVGEKMEHISPLKIKGILDKLNPIKALGMDSITARMLQELPRKTMCWLLQTYNAILRTQYFPQEWRHAKVIVLLKPRKKSKDPASYKPISMLPLISKVFEELVYKRILKLVNKGVIPEYQFGFQEKYSMVEQVSRVVATIQTALKQKEFCTRALLNISQAFDRMWTAGLLHEISFYLSKQVVSLLASYLSNRLFTLAILFSHLTPYKQKFLKVAFTAAAVPILHRRSPSSRGCHHSHLCG